MQMLFISNLGPAVVQSGGNIRLFSEFKKKELWPKINHYTSELFEDLENQPTWILSNCSAVYVDNNWCIMYKTHAGQFRWFNYYFDPALSANPDAPRGTWVGEFAEI